MKNEFLTKKHSCIIKISPLAYDIIERVKLMRLSNGEPSATLSNIASEAIIKVYPFLPTQAVVEYEAKILSDEQKENLRKWMLSLANQPALVEFCQNNKISFYTDITYMQAKAIEDFVKESF